MIHLINCGKYYDTDVGRREILKSVNMSIPLNLRVGILGRNGAGKTTLLKMIAGVENPSYGEVVRRGKISWPLGLSGGLHPDLTGVENISFITRLYRADFDSVFEYVKDFSEIDQYLDMPVKSYSQGMRARLMFGLSLSIDFDCYLIDELTGVGDRFFKEKSKQAFRERAENAGLLFVSHNEKTVKEYCDYALVFYGTSLVPFEDIDEGVDFYLKNGGTA
ncbi:MAG: ABC transporter ATP-binding protein [Proteobacteria bacterium]|nr:ABC transporter ATP-binding protein [Pseudomonadota bacterium]